MKKIFTASFSCIPRCKIQAEVYHVLLLAIRIL